MKVKFIRVLIYNFSYIYYIFVIGVVTALEFSDDNKFVISGFIYFLKIEINYF